MHDRDSDKELTEMIARATSVGPIPRRLMTTAAERTLFGTPELEPVPGTDLVPYEPAGEVATLTDGGVPDTASPVTSDELTFESRVSETIREMTRIHKENRFEFNNQVDRWEKNLVWYCSQYDAALAAA